MAKSNHTCVIYTLLYALSSCPGGLAEVVNDRSTLKKRLHRGNTKDFFYSLRLPTDYLDMKPHRQTHLSLLLANPVAIGLRRPSLPGYNWPVCRSRPNIKHMIGHTDTFSNLFKCLHNLF